MMYFLTSSYVCVTCSWDFICESLSHGLQLDPLSNRSESQGIGSPKHFLRTLSTTTTSDCKYAHLLLEAWRAFFILHPSKYLRHEENLNLECTRLHM